MVQKFKSIIMIVVGIVAIILSIVCFSFKSLDYEGNSMYGGDAFTGIQNAAATTSKNVKELASIVQFGFGSVLLVIGLGFIGVGLTTPMSSPISNNKPLPKPQVPEIEPTETEAPKDEPAAAVEEKEEEKIEE